MGSLSVEPARSKIRGQRCLTTAGLLPPPTPDDTPPHPHPPTPPHLCFLFSFVKETWAGAEGRLAGGTGRFGRSGPEARSGPTHPTPGSKRKSPTAPLGGPFSVGHTHLLSPQQLSGSQPRAGPGASAGPGKAPGGEASGEEEASRRPSDLSVRRSRPAWGPSREWWAGGRLLALSGHTGLSSPWPAWSLCVRPAETQALPVCKP